MLCFPFMVQTGSNMLFEWKTKKYSNYLNVAFKCVCVCVCFSEYVQA